MTAQERILFVLLISLASAAGCTAPPFVGGEAKEVVNLTVPVPPGTALSVRNLNGDVGVAPWNGSAARVEAILQTVYGEEELARANIVVREGNPLIIETVHESSGVRVSTDEEIAVPPGIEVVSVETTNGGIVASGVELTAARASNGRIAIADTTGDLTAATSNGAIDVRAVEGYVTLATSNGGIAVTGVRGIDALTTSNGDITAGIAAVRGDVAITTSNADIRLAITPEINVTIIAGTSGGAITVTDLPLALRQSSATNLAGTSGSGGPTITVLTSNGDIVLSALS